MRVRKAKAGSRPAKAGPKSRSRPGHAPCGRPIQEARITRSRSYSPKPPATIEPATTPASGAHRRSLGAALRCMTLMTTTVAAAARGRRRGRHAFRHDRHATEHDGQHGDRNQHVHGADDGRGQQPPKQREAGGDGEREHGRDENQDGEQTRAAFGEGRNADPDEGPRRTDRQDVSRADPAEPRRLQHRGGAADGYRAEHGPRQVRVGFSCRQDQDGRKRDQSGDSEHDALRAATEHDAARRTLVGLEANALVSIRATHVQHSGRCGSER